MPHRPSPLPALLALALGVRLASGKAATTERSGFTRLEPAATGVVFTNRVPAERYLTNQIALNGSGVALADVDGDGRTDLFLAGYDGGSQLWQNRGEWTFTNITSQAFPSGLLPGIEGTGSVFADIDGDGDTDLVLNTLGQGTRVWKNDGKGRFTPGQTLNPKRAGTSLALADVDGDGDLDLYVANYRGVTVRDDPGAKYQVRDEGGRQRVIAYNGRSTSSPELVGRFSMTPSGPMENGEPDVLYLNDGKGTFAELSWTEGAFLDETGNPLSSPPYDWGLSAMFRDFTGDGLPDLYVCNDFQSEDRFWINETAAGGPPRFRAAPRLALRHSSAFSMGVDGADLDRDGREDLLVLDMLSREHWRRNVQIDGLPPGFHQPGVFDDRPQFSHNTLFLGRGDGTFAEIGRLAGLSASEWAWTPVFLDVDLDGWEDLLVSNGHALDMLDADVGAKAEKLKAAGRNGARELLEMRRMFRPFAAPNAAFRNRGDLTFEDVSQAWGFGEAGVEHGMAAADLDGDGDLDLVLNTLNGPAKLMRNDATAPRLLVRLKGAAANTRGIGARIRVHAEGLPPQSQQMIAGGRYLSGDDTVRTFALGRAGSATVEVTWRSGRITRRTGVPAGNVTIEEVTAETAGPVPVPAPPARFEDVSNRLGHVHVDTPFDDFARQPLLPRDLSQPGPGITWTDLNGDGWDDLLVSSGQGGASAAYTNRAGVGFGLFANPAFSRPTARDLTTLLPVGGAILAGVSNYEDGLTNGGALRVLDLATGRSGEVLGGRAAAVGSMAAADVDGDGSLEIFVGVRAVAGRYPEAATSYLVRNQGGRLGIATRFENLGLAQGAVFTDLDGDGRPDLAVSCEWGSVHLFLNRQGTLSEWDPPIRGNGLPDGVKQLSQWTGWWQGLTAADVDSDGRMDLVAGNWGRNHFLGAAAEHRPLRVRHGDLNGDGLYDLVESYVGPDGVELPVRRQSLLAGVLPSVATKFPTLEEFGRATLPQLLEGTPARLPVLAALQLDSGVLLNRGDHFEWRPLPVAAQLAPVFGIVVSDFDGDGTEDLYLAQNFFGIPKDEARYDGGRGLLLRGDGRGGFTEFQDPGLSVWGEQRGAAAADFDGDGRTDLAVGQNSAATRLFRNTAAIPGLRVQLRGGPQNPDGMGASVRWITPAGAGPRREIRAGGGWCSVDSPVTVLGTARAAGELEVRWPGHAPVRHPVKAGAARVLVGQNGSVEVNP